KGGGGGHRPRHRVGGEIGEEEIELLLCELEALAVGQVGGIEDDERALAVAGEGAEGLPVEDLLVVVLGREVDAAEVGRSEPEPVNGIGRAADERALDIDVEESWTEVREDPVA